MLSPAIPNTGDITKSMRWFIVSGKHSFQEKVWKCREVR
jgi:hypothetical protein